MNGEPDDVIRAELQPAEQLLWAGRPRQGWRVRASDWVFIAFGLIWTGIALFGCFLAIMSDASLSASRGAQGLRPGPVRTGR
jgi:hypothetical protein